MVEYTQSPTYVVSGIIWLLQATTEQPTFVGLLAYRMKWPKKTVAKILKFAAIQTFVIKTAAAIGAFVYWATKQLYTYRSIDYVWSAMTVIIVLGLMGTQVWGSWITYMIGVRIENQHKSQRHGENGGDDDDDDHRSLTQSPADSSTLYTRSQNPTYTNLAKSDRAPESVPLAVRPEIPANAYLDDTSALHRSGSSTPQLLDNNLNSRPVYFDRPYGAV